MDSKQNTCQAGLGGVSEAEDFYLMSDGVSGFLRQPLQCRSWGVGWTVTVILGLNSDPKFQSGSQLPKFYGAGQDLQAAPGSCCSFLSIEDWTRNSLISLRLHYLWWERFEDKIKEILGLFGSYWSPSSGWGLVTLISVGGSCLLLPREELSSLYLVHTHTHIYTHIY